MVDLAMDGLKFFILIFLIVLHHVSTLTILLVLLLNWYTRSASPLHATRGAQSWHKLPGGTNKCTASEGLLRTYCSIPYTGPVSVLFTDNQSENENWNRLKQLLPVCHGHIKEVFCGTNLSQRLLLAKTSEHCSHQPQQIFLVNTFCSLKKHHGLYQSIHAFLVHCQLQSLGHLEIQL